MFVLSGVIAAGSLIPAAVRFFKGDPQSQDALTKIGIGMLVLLIILGIIKLTIFR